jgi:predicted RNA-binding Zn ribbon-like protein
MEVSELEANLPVLGEPIPVELANTRYRDGDEVIEFLADPALVSAWFDASPTAHQLHAPQRWSESDRRRLIDLRDALDHLFRARIGTEVPEPHAVEQLNDAAARVIRRVELTWDRDGGPQRVERLDAPDRIDAVLAAIADQAIRLLAGPDADLLRICANDDCQLLFVRQHHRRRWCHNSCGHRHRQAAYYRAHHGRPT